MPVYMNEYRVHHKMLALQLHSAEEANKKQRWSFAETSDAGRDEKLRMIEKEMKEQETLIHGYHLVSLSLCWGSQSSALSAHLV